MVADGPAAKAGLQPGDIITEAGGQYIRTMERLVEEVQKAGHGGKLGIVFFRGNAKLAVTASL